MQTFDDYEYGEEIIYVLNVYCRELHNLRFTEASRTSGFVEVKHIRCVIGQYPKKLVQLWKTYDEEKNSENDCPSMFDDDQLYIVLELGHGGEDLEAFVFQNASEAHALFIQANYETLNFYLVVDQWINYRLNFRRRWLWLSRKTRWNSSTVIFIGAIC